MTSVFTVLNNELPKIGDFDLNFETIFLIFRFLSYL